MFGVVTPAKVGAQAVRLRQNGMATFAGMTDSSRRPQDLRLRNTPVLKLLALLGTGLDWHMAAIDGFGAIVLFEA